MLPSRLRYGVLLACLPPLAAPGCGPKTPPEPLALGQLLTLTGPDRTLGEHAERGAALALKTLREENKKVLGRELVVRHVDTRGVPETAQAEAVRLLRVNRVAGLLGGPDAATAERAARAAQPYDVPFLVTTDMSSLPVGDAIFSLTVPPATRGLQLARFAVQDLKAGRAAVVSDTRGDISLALAAGFGREWRKLKSTPPEEWSYREESDRAALPDRLARARADVILLATTPTDFSRFQTELASAKVTAPLLYGGGDRGVDEPATVFEGSGDVYLATVYAPSGLSPRGRTFAKQYEAEYREPPDLAAAQAYEGVGLLADALNRAGTTTAAKLREELAATDKYEGLTGPLALKDRRARRNLFVVRSRGKSTEVVRTFGPEDE